MIGDKDTIAARISYSYQGKVKSFESILNLELLHADQIRPGLLHGVIAREHGLDTYSYEYEVMEMAEIVFSAPTGRAAAFFHNGVFDLAGYLAMRDSDVDWTRVQAIAAGFLNGEALDRQPELAALLKAVYLAGRQDALNRETAVGSQKSTQALGASGKPENLSLPKR